MWSRRVIQALFALLLSLGLSGQAFADEVVDGRVGPGALYRLVRPTNWNGSLMIYAHGYVSPDAPVALPPEANLFVTLVTQFGFAIAFSSYSENGWTVKDGAPRTHGCWPLHLEVRRADTRLPRWSIDGRPCRDQADRGLSRALRRSAGGVRRRWWDAGRVRLSCEHARLVRRRVSACRSSRRRDTVSLTATTAAEIAAKATAAIASDAGVGP